MARATRQTIAADCLKQLEEQNDHESRNLCIRFLFGEVRRIREAVGRHDAAVESSGYGSGRMGDGSSPDSQSAQAGRGNGAVKSVRAREIVAADCLKQLGEKNDIESQNLCIRFLFGEVRRLREHVEGYEIQSRAAQQDTGWRRESIRPASRSVRYTRRPADILEPSQPAARPKDSGADDSGDE